MVYPMNSGITASSIPSFDVQFPASADGKVPIRGVFQVIWRRKFLVTMITVAIMAVAAAVILSLPPYYKSTATLLIDPQQTQPIPQLPSSDGPQIDMVAVKTQVAIIQSFTLAMRVVEALDLVNTPEFVAELDASVNPVLGWVKRLEHYVLGNSSQAVPLTPEERKKTVATMLLGRVAASNDGKSYLVEISAQSKDSQLGSKIANTFAKVYLNFNRKLKIDAIEEANARFFDQLPPLAEKVRDADRAIQTFRAANGLTTISSAGQTDGHSVTLAESQLAQVNTQIGEAVFDRTEREGRLQQINEALHGRRQIDAIPEIVGSGLIQALRQKQANLRSQQAALETSAMKANPNMIAVQAAQANVSATINAEMSKIAASVASSVVAARQREEVLRQRLEDLKALVSSQSEAEIKLRDLQNQADAAREVYLSYLHRFQQTASLGLMQQPDAELISLAEVPLGPAGPKRMQLLMLAAALAAIFSVLCALLRDRLSAGSGFTSASLLEAVTGLTVIGSLPRLRRGVQDRSPRKVQFFHRESLNHVRATMEFGDQQYRANVVLVTSAVPQEGKTHFANSLVQSIAARGGRALLIDCNQTKQAIGTTHVSAAQADSINAGKSVRQTSHLSITELSPGLDVGTLRTARSSPGTQPSLRLVRDELNAARDKYDMIILDGPPIIACADAELFCDVVDGVLMVVRWGATTRGTVLAALQMMQVYGIRTIGAVLNDIDMKQLTKSDSGLGEFYSGYNYRAS
jgi:succinoglycan biosynthesis transport protein ExoP